MLTVRLDVTEVVPLLEGKSTFTPLLTRVEIMMKKIRRRKTRSVIELIPAFTLILFRVDKFIAAKFTLLALQEYQ